MHSDTVSWAEVLARLSDARNYWLNTIALDGAPHVAPVWGAAVDSTLYLYTERSTVKAHNLGRDPRAIVHLESAQNVVIVHATLEDVGLPEQAPQVVNALAQKYRQEEDQQYLPSQNPEFDVIYAVHPRRALLWRLDNYETSQQRWAAK